MNTLGVGGLLSYWMMYGMMTGTLIILGLYLLMSRTSVFADCRFQPATHVRRWAGVNILVVGLEYLLVLCYIGKFSTYLSSGTVDNGMEYALMCHEQINNLFLLPTTFIFLFTLFQGFTPVRIHHILWSVSVPMAMLIWIVVQYHTSGETQWDVVHTCLIVSRLYWITFGSVMIFLFSKYRRLFNRELEQHFSDTSRRDFHGLGYLAAFMVVTYVFDFFVYLSTSHLFLWMIVAQISDCLCAIFITWRVDQQQLIVWETPQEEEPLSPVIAQLGKNLDSLMQQQALYLNSDFCRDDLVAALNTNRTYLNMVLSARGMTFYQYINHLRVEHACRLIQSSADALSVKDIATASGFNNPESFTRQFKAVVGATPQRIR